MPFKLAKIGKYQRKQAASKSSIVFCFSFIILKRFLIYLFDNLIHNRSFVHEQSKLFNPFISKPKALLYNAIFNATCIAMRICEYVV